MKYKEQSAGRGNVARWASDEHTEGAHRGLRCLPLSELSAADHARQRRLTQDVQILPFASPEVKRWRKSGWDSGERLADRSRCWFAARLVLVKRANGLTVERREEKRLSRSFAGTRARRRSPWCAGRFQLREKAPPSPWTVRMTGSRATTTTETAGSRSRRRDGTESLPFTGRTRRTGTCREGDGVVCR